MNLPIPTQQALIQRNLAPKQRNESFIQIADENRARGWTND